jgi:Cdc6-like AAA superfamily ATPase
MINIVAQRLAMAEPQDGELVKVDPKAVELLTKKVEAQNGDLRMCLGVLSLAVTLAENEWTKKVAAAVDIAVPLIKISLPHTIKAFNSHTQQLKAAAGSTSSAMGSINGKKIRSVPLQGKMVLLAALVYLTRIRAGLPGCPATSSSGTSTPTSTPSKSSEYLTTANLYATYVHLLSHTSSPFPPSSESDYRDLLSNLEVLALVHLNATSTAMSRSGSGVSRKSVQGQRVELCVRDDEVKEGLGLGEGVKGKGVAEEEVGKVWEREDAKIKRAREKVSKAAAMVMED